MAAQKTGTRIAVIEIDHYRCIGCTVCVQSCTNDVLRMKAGKACIAYQEDCSACFSCEIDCPRDAVYLGLIDGAY